VKLAYLVLTIALLAACQGCPAPDKPVISIVQSDGSTLPITIDTACDNLSTKCDIAKAACVDVLTPLVNRSPQDLACMLRAADRETARNCLGVGSACP